MSGFAGIFYRGKRPVDRADLERMINMLKHRGPDGQGLWCDGFVGFGHRMLHTTPESLKEKLPLTNHPDHLTITADARLDNRTELILVLEPGGRPVEINDSQLILAAYKKWGENCPQYLLGDFAFVIWDKLFYLVYQARSKVAPNLKDYRVLPLPTGLSFLYYPLRPVRLIKEYGLTVLKELQRF